MSSHHTRIARLALAAALLGHGAIARADDLVLDYRTTTELAAAHAREAVAARGRAEATRATRATAAVRPNPELGVTAGPRFIDDERTLDLEVRLGQRFELGGKRGRRIALAEAEAATATALAADAERLAAKDAALAYCGALAAERRLALAREVETVADAIAAATDRRVAKGDALDLDAKLARAAQGRAHAAVRAATADRELALGALRALVGADGATSVRVTGELDAIRAPALASLVAAAPARADVNALAAEARAGTAQAALGDGLAWPDLTFEVGYAREESAQLVLAGITLALPVFDRGADQERIGRARAAAATAEKAALVRALDAEVRAAYAAYEERVAAAAELAAEVAPIVDASDELLRKAYDAGQLTLADYLASRRELLDARVDVVEREREAAEAAVELTFAAGVTP
jgi:outer membrane protein, heavy metal efflux system